MSLIDPILLIDVVAVMVDGFVASGYPVVPDGRIDDIRKVVATALVGPVALQEYLVVLHARFDENLCEEPEGTAVELLTDELRTTGLGALTSIQLVRLAITPGAMRATNEFISESLRHGTAGKYWEDVELLPDDVFPPDYLGEAAVQRQIALFAGS
jgi:hypothetical protein